MPDIGQRAFLRILSEKPYGLLLDAEEKGEVLLPRGEMPDVWELGESLDVFLYRDSEDRPVATLRTALGMPGEFVKLRCVETTSVGAFLDIGLAKDLLVPFREQREKMSAGKWYLVRILVDEKTGRLMGSERFQKFLGLKSPDYLLDQEVNLIVMGRTPLGYKVIINGAHEGLLYESEVFSELITGEKAKGFIKELRHDGKIDVSLHPPGRKKVDDLEQQLMGELVARGGFLPLHDKTSAEEIYAELGVSKRTFKQALGGLLRQRLVSKVDSGIRLN